MSIDARFTRRRVVVVMFIVVVVVFAVAVVVVDIAVVVVGMFFVVVVIFPCYRLYYLRKKINWETFYVILHD